MERSTWQVSVVVLVTAGLVLAQGAIHRLRGDPGQFGTNIDESSHFMTGLMIRDYVASGIRQSPIAFAKQYYLHYPKVAFGSWPPLLHIFLGAWLLVWPATRQSAILYIDVLTVLFALTSVYLARRRLPWLPSIGIGAAVWLAPSVQALDQGVQADTQYALLSVVCVAVFGAYLERPGRWRALWFGLALFGAVMSKNNALFLGISLPVAVLLTRSFRVVRRWDLWLAILPAAVSVLVWQYMTLPFVENNMKGVTPESMPGLALFTYLGKMATLIWIGLLPFVLWGIRRHLWIPLWRGHKVEVFDAVLGALLIGPLLFHSMLPHDVNQRYLLPTLPALLIYALSGLLDLLSIRAFTGMRRPVRLALSAIMISLPAAASPIPPLSGTGYAEVAARLVAEYPANRFSAILVEASFGGEALLISEMAVREPRPGHWLLRGLKIFRRKTGTLNRQTELVTTDSAAMLQYLKTLPVMLIVVGDEAGDMARDREYLANVMREEPDLFRQVMSVPYGDGCRSCTIRVFRMGSPNPGTRFAPERLPRNMHLWHGL